MPLWPSDRFSEVADWCTVIGLAITARVWVISNRIRKDVARRITFPEIVDAIRLTADTLAIYQDPQVSRGRHVGNLVSTLEGKVNDLRNYTGPELEDSLRTMMDKVRRYKHNNSQVDFDAMSQDVYRLLEELHGYARRM
jgi:hypothetical protein